MYRNNRVKGSYMLIDKQELKVHFDNDIELISELVVIFEETYPVEILGIKKSLEEKDFKGLELHAHTLKGMIANFFSKELREFALLLERMGKTKIIDSDLSVKCLGELEAKIPQLTKEVREIK